MKTTRLLIPVLQWAVFGAIAGELSAAGITRMSPMTMTFQLDEKTVETSTAAAKATSKIKLSVETANILIDAGKVGGATVATVAPAVASEFPSLPSTDHNALAAILINTAISEEAKKADLNKYWIRELTIRLRNAAGRNEKIGVAKDIFPGVTDAEANLFIDSFELAVAGNQENTLTIFANIFDKKTSDGAETFGAAGIMFTSKLDLVTTNVFIGGMSTRIGDGNVFITSSLPAKDQSTAEENRYSDTQLLLPTGGVVNFLLTPGASIGVATRSKISTGGIPYGRGELSDRNYFVVDKGTPKDTETLTKLLGTAEMRGYWVYAVGPKMINRSGKGDTVNNVDGYGLAGTAYLGLGFDGGFSSVADSDAAGNYRIENYLLGTWTDRTTMRGLYPDTDTPTSTSAAWAGTLSISINGRFQLQAQWAVPLGSSRKFMKRVMFIGFSLSR